MQITFKELFDMVEKASTEDEKIGLLKKHESPALRGLLKINFHPGVDMGLPEGEPPYKKNDAPLNTNHEYLINTYKTFYIWLDPKQQIPKIRKETLFLSMLESLHQTEAELICLIKDKLLQSKYPSVSEELVRKVFPQILPPLV